MQYYVGNSTTAWCHFFPTLANKVQIQLVKPQKKKQKKKMYTRYLQEAFTQYAMQSVYFHICNLGLHSLNMQMYIFHNFFYQ